jgi:hypothetical protein
VSRNISRRQEACSEAVGQPFKTVQRNKVCSNAGEKQTIFLRAAVFLRYNASVTAAKLTNTIKIFWVLYIIVRTLQLQLNAIKWVASTLTGTLSKDNS